jgi:hypothetical protein
MRIVLGGTIVLLLVVAAIMMWPADRAPTLPDTGPGAARVTGSANVGGVDASVHRGDAASGEGPSPR